MNKNGWIKQCYRGLLRRIYVGILMDVLHKLHHRLLNIDGFAGVKESFQSQASQFIPTHIVADEHIIRSSSFYFISFFYPFLCKAVRTDGVHVMQGKLTPTLIPTVFQAHPNAKDLNHFSLSALLCSES